VKLSTRSAALIAAVILAMLLCPNIAGAKATASASGSAARAKGTLPDAYVQSVKNRIYHFWCPAKGANAKVTVNFRILTGGQVTWVEVADASENPAANQAAEDAILNASPFSALPAGAGLSADLAVEFSSDYAPILEHGYARPAESDRKLSQQRFADATEHAKEGKWDDAIREFKKAAESSPFDVRIRDALVDCYIRSARCLSAEEAMSRLHQALLLDHSSAAASRDLNELLQKSGKTPFDYSVRLALARQYAGAGKFDDALAEYGEAWTFMNSPELIPEINATCAKRRASAEVQKWQNVLAVSDTPEIRQALASAQSQLASNDGSQLLQSAALAEDFPYQFSGKRALSVSVLKNRQVAVDYLTQANPGKFVRWPVNRIPLKVYIENAPGVPGWKPAFNVYMRDAFAAWVKASDGRLTFDMVGDPYHAKIVCHWVRTPDPSKFDNPREQGVTLFKWLYERSNPKICNAQSAEIYILTVRRGTDDVLDDESMRIVCLHELGHALGIAGHSPYDDDIMYPMLNGTRKLSPRDIASIRKLYQGYAH
jgi:TonB family protein